ncbi:type VI secretion system Vgr family protein [Methylocella sp.]|uniref:type VI secretion system Vgr family protein n=1 Tax=Methylocella sp. TaxID=1978226 RepID=UPI0037840D05
MTSELAQDTRLAVLETPLGKDKLAARRFDGAEGLSELFEFRVEAASLEADLDFDRAIGANCSVALKSYDGRERLFNGVLVEAQAAGSRGEQHLYRLTLRPWLWLLSRTSDCRIFENKTALDIVKEVFKGRGLSDFSDRTTSGYPELDYCVQYRETDLAFVSRLMERHGIYYFFEYSKDKHTLVLADAKSSHKPAPGLSKLPFLGGDRQERRDREHVATWTPQRRFRSGKFALVDYDYLQPTADLKSDAQGQARYARSKMEIYDYPGNYKKKSDGETYARVRLEAEQAQDRRKTAEGDSVSLFPGALTTLDGHPSAGENREYLVLRALHAYNAQSYRSGEGGFGDLYSGRYELLPSDVPFRARLATPRPLVHGPQTAKVVGKDGEEIDVDEHGRILVRFFWDRKNRQSCRVRVAQVWAGKGWGGQAIPRIGQEVVVEFLEGDPDRPLVTGAVYNADYKHPYEMPADKTQSGLKSDSSKGHGGYNEFMFEDKKGAETIRMHGERDHEVKIRRAETVEIGEVFAGHGDPSRKTTLRNGSDELSIQNGDQTIDVKGKQDVTVLQTIAVEALQKITFTVGASSITIDPVSVTINAPMITVQSSIKTDVSGGAMINLTAGIIKIN